MAKAEGLPPRSEGQADNGCGSLLLSEQIMLTENERGVPGMTIYLFVRYYELGVPIERDRGFHAEQLHRPAIEQQRLA